MNLQYFSTEPFPIALKIFFEKLRVPIHYFDEAPASAKDILGEKFKPENPAHKLIEDVYVFGLIDETAFSTAENSQTVDKIKTFGQDYDGILIFGITLRQPFPTRLQLAEISRSLNRAFPSMPVTVIFKYSHHIAFTNSERTSYKQAWKEGEKIGKVTMLRDIDPVRTNAAHLRILFGDRTSQGLQIDPSSICSFKKLYAYWQKVFSLQSLNDQFYQDLQQWFYFATQNIQLPYRQEYISEQENIKNFLVRLLARTMFCWFVKEKGLIRKELLELTDWDGNRYKLTNDVEEKEFLWRNSYYRGIMQNMFYCALNQKEKKSLKDFKWTKYLHPEFQISWFTEIPYLNGGIFDKLDEDNAKETIEDSVIKIPNFLFYGIENESTFGKIKGSKSALSTESIGQKGLNEILKSYKFTLDENTPFEEDIALDPELLGLVFENLLAELDPNLEETTIKSIRKLTGSYYTPRKIILEMVNDSLYLYLLKFIRIHYPCIGEAEKLISNLVYLNLIDQTDKTFCEAIVNGLDRFKMLDPACGSGAFPMGMLHRMVDILKQADAFNELWIDLKLKNVDPAQRVDFKKVLTAHLDDYGRKLGIIRDSIYGIDIQPLAVQITKLRFFISLLIDQKTDREITPMPNIETKIICANSLNNIHPDLFSSNAIEQLSAARTCYYQPDISHEKREMIADEIAEILDISFPSFAFQVTGERRYGQNKALIKEWFKHGTLAAPFFNMEFFFPELQPSGGFDCVIGNPPYGGTKITEEMRNALKIESKDPYGAFIARFLNSSDTSTPLKHGGVLAFIVSDTFMTIKSHLKLRKHLMQNYLHKMIRMHPDTFRATVNTAIMVAERNTGLSFNENHICLMADMTNISIHEDYEHFTEVLAQTKGVGFESIKQNISNEEYAIYYYPQALIKTNSNLPFFVASPKLFALMNDGNDPAQKPQTLLRDIGGKPTQIRLIEMNGKEIEIVKLGTIAEVKQGLATGDNDAYLFQNPDARGTYRNIEEYKEYLLTEEDLDKIRKNEKLRLAVIHSGISKDNSSSERYFGGRYIIPYDKGGESDAEGGWMPNYFVPTNYFIDWSEWAISRMKTLTTAQRNLLEGKNGGDNKLCSRFQNIEYSFTNYITYSRTGVYAPTFRLNTAGAFDTKSNGLFISGNTEKLGLFNSILYRYLFKNFYCHTVQAEGDALEETPTVSFLDKNIEKLVRSILVSQKSDPHYDYASHEQIEIDKLVYEAYGLNKEDIQEVENWYARRYPKLSKAQKQNLRNLGKSDDYLELYGMK